MEKILLFLISSLFCLGCTDRKAYGGDSIPVKICRFDTDIYQYIRNESDEKSLEKDSPFLNIYGENIIGIGKVDSTGFYERLKSFFSEPTLMGMYKDEQHFFLNTEEYEKELSIGFRILLNKFPEIKLPQIGMHVSGLNQNIIVTDSFLSLSADKYLGSDYPLYQQFFYDYQLKLMSPERVVPDYLLGFLMSRFIFKGNEDVLLDRMLYEGKLRYILSLLLPERQIWESVAYSEEEWNWCVKNEDKIWKTILQQKQLYTQDYLITSQYINEAPHTTPLTASSPGRVGIWVGYRIISSYMENNMEISVSELLKKNNYLEILKESKYKP